MSREGFTFALDRNYLAGGTFHKLLWDTVMMCSGSEQTDAKTSGIWILFNYCLTERHFRMQDLM